MVYLSEFQSTLPIQGETTAEMAQKLFENISIHSPYTGRDRKRRQGANIMNISIHSPYTGRDTEEAQKDILENIFKSTLPIQGETIMDVRR